MGKLDNSGIKVVSNLREYRKKERYSQQDIADKISVSRQTIVAIENGNYNPSLILAYRISKLFNVSIEEMFEFIDVKSR